MGSKHRRKSKPRGQQGSTAAPSVADGHTSDLTNADLREQRAEGDDVPVEMSPAEVSGEVESKSNPPANDQPTPDSDVIGTSDVDKADPTISIVPAVIPLNDAKKLLEMFFVALLAANVCPLAIFRSLSCEQIQLGELVELLESHRSDIEVLFQAQCALQALCVGDHDQVDVNALIELASAATFRIEMLEFQIRQAILDKASSKTRAMVDIHRVVSKLASQLSEDAVTVTAKDFEAMLEEKLAVSAGSSILCRVVFARITGQPFAPSLPKNTSVPKSHFFSSLELFVADKPLSMEFVEGQLRHLVAKHADLRASFRTIDTDNSGSISLVEFVLFLQREAQMDYPRNVITSFIQRFDTDGDGTLSYDEFVDFVSPKQFGIQVLTPFGMFYHATDRREPMGEVVAKIKTRMFWMQHNDLFSTTTQPVHKPPLKLKVTDHFILTHHYGTLRLQFKATDPIATVLKNGEMVVLVLEPEPKTMKAAMESSSTKELGDLIPDFEYRLHPKCKRSILPLMAMTLRDSAVGGGQHAKTVAKQIKEKGLMKNLAGTGVGNGDDNELAAPVPIPIAPLKNDGTSRKLSQRTTKPQKSHPQLLQPPTLALKENGTSAAVRCPVRQTHKKREAPCVPVLEPEKTHANIHHHGFPREIITSPVASTTDYEYYDHSPSVSSGEENEAPLFNDDDDGVGDEFAPPPLVETRNLELVVDCDEESPPPYDG